MDTVVLRPTNWLPIRAITRGGPRWEGSRRLNLQVRHAVKDRFSQYFQPRTLSAHLSYLEQEPCAHGNFFEANLVYVVWSSFVRMQVLSHIQTHNIAYDLPFVMKGLEADYVGRDFMPIYIVPAL